MRLRLFPPGLIALVLLFAACAPPPELRDETLLRDDSLITGEPCEAPCWRSIIPGETLWRDAELLIKDNSDFEEYQTQTDEASGARGAIWKPAGGTLCCQVIAEDGETVNLILLRIAPDLTLEEVFEVQGEPAYAIGDVVSEDQAVVNLIYPDKPMILFAFVAGEAGSLSASSEIVGAFYMTQERMDLFMQTISLHEWEGYADYAAYSSSEDADFEVTPSITLTPAE